MNFKYSFVLLFVATFTISCERLNQGSRITKNVNKETYYGIDNKSNSTKTELLIPLFSKSMQKAFSLEEIENSIYENEIRIYFASVWHERFYYSHTSGDSIYKDLFSCRTERKCDSLFMRLGDLLTWRGKLNEPKINTNFLPIYKVDLPSDTAILLDKGYTYFVETKNGKEFHKVLVNDNYLEKHNDSNSKNIKNFIHAVAKANNFNFSDEWKKIDSNAFISK